MINLLRLHCWKNGRFWLLDIEPEKEQETKAEVRREGWEELYTELV